MEKGRSNKNHIDPKKESRDSFVDSYIIPSDSCIEDNFDPEFNESLHSILKHMDESEKKHLKHGPMWLEICGKLDPKYYSDQVIKNAELGKSIPVPPTYQQVVITTDPLMSDGLVILTVNRASQIFHAIASAVFKSSDALLANQAKLMFLRQIENDYSAAKERNDGKGIQRYTHLVSKTGMKLDEPWFDEEWLVASKAFFAPIHVLYNCRRVPCNPHVYRYQFSPVLDEESPIRIVVDNGE